eukprot:48271-Hanusia_phi.AAC.1
MRVEGREEGKGGEEGREKAREEREEKGREEGGEGREQAIGLFPFPPRPPHPHRLILPPGSSPLPPFSPLHFLLPVTCDQKVQQNRVVDFCVGTASLVRRRGGEGRGGKGRDRVCEGERSGSGWRG